MRISDWSSDGCSSDLGGGEPRPFIGHPLLEEGGHRSAPPPSGSPTWTLHSPPLLTSDASLRARPSSALDLRSVSTMARITSAAITSTAVRVAKTTVIFPLPTPLVLSLSKDHTQRQPCDPSTGSGRSEEHTSELQSLMRISYAVFCLKKK